MAVLQAQLTLNPKLTALDASKHFLYQGSRRVASTNGALHHAGAALVGFGGRKQELAVPRRGAEGAHGVGVRVNGGGGGVVSDKGLARPPLHRHLGEAHTKTKAC